jgi:hypothetical protein
VAEALWEEDGTVVPVAPPSDEDVARILARCGCRAVARRGARAPLSGGRSVAAVLSATELRQALAPLCERYPWLEAERERFWLHSRTEVARVLPAQTVV